MNKLFTTAILFSFCIAGNSQINKKEDVKAIKSMCGCYEVEFNFAETFQYSKDESYVPSETKYDRGLEWIELVEDQPNKLVLQHILIVNDTMLVKHWRQDWEFENTSFYQFYKDKSWKYQTLAKDDVKGQWTQRVFQVDDSPRYEGSASWVHVDGRHYWEDNTDAPLPRREQTIRKDYNVLNRTNVHEITKDGWIHDQDNVKLLRSENSTDVAIAKEKGTDYYKKVADSKCLAGQKYWKENAAMWKNVRDKWQTVFNRKLDLNLENRVNKKPLYSYLFDLKADTPKAETDKIIDTFVKR
ncbi:DUF6607 family protein [Flavobacterium hiemivividum]|uniref:Uncharacterized protein n=1 Tax=Flavobacterium hiemivividum TaxID=2541734 RepID=A0A4R5CXW1_9FLAO|nr:DUF6607 family protein [Flavobacterium hiemivividum]TDE02683.1 hypothetical protein E0F98_12820 [Flavobacterium hiemivividum]